MSVKKISPIKYFTQSQEVLILFPKVYYDLRKLTVLTKLAYSDAELFNLGFFPFYFLNILFIYLGEIQRERKRERGRNTGRGRSKKLSMQRA